MTIKQLQELVGRDPIAIEDRRRSVVVTFPGLATLIKDPLTNSHHTAPGADLRVHLKK